MARALVWLIDLYQRRGGGRRYLVECNFTPSCSAYAKQAIRRFGAIDGMRLAVARIRRCTDPNRHQKISDPVPDACPAP